MTPAANPDDRSRPAWQDAIATERMAVDRAFTEQVAASALSNDSWELVMTAVELEIRGPSDPETAELVANTDRLSSVLPAIASIEAQRDPGSGPGLVGRLRGRLPWVSGPSDDYRRTAEALAGAYAQALRAKLESAGRWETICAMAAEDNAGSEE